MTPKELDTWIDGYKKACCEIKSILNEARLYVPDMESKKVFDNLWNTLEHMNEKAHQAAPTVEIEVPPQILSKPLDPSHDNPLGFLLAESSDHTTKESGDPSDDEGI